MATILRQKRWFKVLLSIIIVLLVIGGVLYYLVNYRVRDILQVVVNKESKGKYGFNADAVDISFTKRNIIIRNALLFCRDTAHTSPHYEVKIPELYVAIQSWKELLFYKKISVDSLYVVNPKISAHDHLTNTGQPTGLHVSGISEKIEQLLQQLQVRSFRVQDAEFSFSRADSPVPLAGDHINFYISNFSKNKDVPGRLFSSDDIDLSMGAQNWVLPGNREISFKGLHFSGKDQFVKLDSCRFQSAPGNGKAGMDFSAEKLFFNSKELAAMYLKDELLIDSLICFRPALHVETTSRKNKKSDSTASVSQALSQIFSTVHFNYIDVKDGELSLINRYNPNYATQKANFTAYNLHISKDAEPAVTTDSVRLQLSNLEFLTTDSMFIMKVAAFSLQNNDVLFTDAVYAPTAQNRSPKGFTFVAPALRLTNINMAELMNKRLVADKAELLQPVITVFDRSRQTPGTDTVTATANRSPAQKKNFYQTLHGLQELIAVQHFNIVNGSLDFTSSAAATVHLNMKKINAEILLNKLFLSDSLIDIKRSLPAVSTQLVSVHSPKMDLFVVNYTFNGISRHNKADRFQVRMAGGTTVEGKDLYWEIFDWDMYANHKIIQVDFLKLGELIVVNKKPGASVNASAQPKKDLPVLHIARFNIDKLRLRQSGTASSMGFEARDICVDNIGSQKSFFTWNNAEGFFNNIVFTGKNGAKLSADNIRFNTQYASVAQNIQIATSNEKGSSQLDIPTTTIKTDIHSTDFSLLRIPLLQADNASIDIVKKQTLQTRSAAGTGTGMPLSLFAAQLRVNNASLNYRVETSKDTLTLSTKINIDATSVHTFKTQQQLVTYDTVMIALFNLKAGKSRVNLAMPRTVLSLAGGKGTVNAANKLSFQSGVEAVWNNAGFAFAQTDTTGIWAELSGSFKDNHFKIEQGAKINWQEFAYKTNINKGGGRYRSKNVTAEAGSITWHPKDDKLSLRHFFVVPNQDMGQTFAKPGAWQGDYMTIQGEAAHITGIRYRQQTDDSALTIKKIELDSISLTTTRDKRMPFRHGIEKAMPVVLINSLKLPLSVDSVLVRRSGVLVNEIAIKSEKKGTIPLSDINAIITNVKSRGNGRDSLSLMANARLLDYKISNFYYKEAYADSLAYFFAGVHISKMALPAFSSVTIPLASVEVDNGEADTLFARWTGNKYAAVGKMDFYYKGLKIRLLDAKDNSKKKFILRLGNFVAGLILRKNNDATAQMFFVRDREKFIFNYWVKTILSGLSTSAGIKRNKKMLKKYRQVKDQYALPVLYD